MAKLTTVRLRFAVKEGKLLRWSGWEYEKSEYGFKEEATKAYKSFGVRE